MPNCLLLFVDVDMKTHSNDNILMITIIIVHQPNPCATSLVHRILTFNFCPTSLSQPS